MPRFVACPVVVEAHRWEGNSVELPDEFRMVLSSLSDGTALIRGVVGSKIAQRGDWLVRGGDGQIVVMKEAAFEVAFEEQPHEPAERIKRPYNRKEQAHV